MKTAAGRQPEKFDDRAERERIHFNKVTKHASPGSLRMSEKNILRYANPPSDTPFPLEYAFHLLGPVAGKTVIDLGCGDGLNTVILASLGAQVISVDVSDESLSLTERRAVANGVAGNIQFVHCDAANIPVENNVADVVLCAALLHHVDCIATAQRIVRILKPGCRAVFLEPVAGPPWSETIKRFVPKASVVSEDEQPLTRNQVHAVSSVIGREGRGRDFGLTMRLLTRLNMQAWSIVKSAHLVDAGILRLFPALSAIASPTVWEAIKE